MATEREQPLWLTIVIVAMILGGAVAAFYDIAVPGSATEVVGEVVKREMTTTEYGPRPWMWVRLDRGDTVVAGHARFATITPGDRVVLMQVESPLLGRLDYRYKEHVNRSRSLAPPAVRPTP